ncbi:MAG: hypothetical protein ACQESK_09565 [Bacteroidota bacterium]
MLTIFIYIIAGVLILFGLVKLIDKFLPNKLRPVIALIFTVLIVYLGYLNYNAVYGPVEFNKIKEKRYQKVIDRLKDIRDVQEARKEVVGSYEKTFEGLYKFLDTAEFTITQRRDTSYIDQDFLETHGVDRYIDDYVVDTLGTISVKDSLFKNDDRYKNLHKVPFTDEKKPIIDAGVRKMKDNNVPVFEAKVPKEWVLTDQDPNLVEQEKQIKSVEGVDGEFISVGSMTEITTSGNWPSSYESRD